MKPVKYGTGLLLFGILSLSGAEKIVADPYRAAEVSWPSHSVAGRDFWLLLDPRWLDLKGVSDEPFVRESGTGFVPLGITGKNTAALRVMTLREIVFRDAAGRKVEAEIQVVPMEKNTLVEDPQNLTDGSIRRYCVVSGSLTDLLKRYAPVECTLKISAKRPVKTIQIHHGNRQNNRVASASVRNLTEKDRSDSRPMNLKLEQPEKIFELKLRSHASSYSAPKLAPAYYLRLKKAPFTIVPPFRHASGNLLGLGKENFDSASFAAVRKTYGENFLGYWMPEWDSNLFQTLTRPNRPYYQELLKYLKVPCDKEEMVKNMKIVWDMHKPVFGDDLLGLSGQVHFMHHACDWGSTVSATELTQERPEHAGRVSIMFTRGAARQFDRPMMIYQAYYGGSVSPNSQLRGKERRLDFGVAPSLPLRNFYVSYYMGNNYLDFEAQVYGMVKEEKDGTNSLTANGKALKEIFEWTRSRKGKRGTCYTPILLLADRKHGYDMWYRIAPKGWGNFYNLYPPTDANYLLEYVMQVISPRYDYYKYDDPKYSGNLHNSTVGDIFDLYLANPLVAGEVRLEQLEKYPVVCLIDDITWTDKLANNIKQYVGNGGTLVLTAGQAAPFEDDPEFLGAKIGTESVKSDNLSIRKLQLVPGAETVMKTTNGTPLVISKSYGAGKTLLIASPFMKKLSAVTQVPPQLVSLFEKIQAEVLPVQVKGDCEFLFNIMPDGTWKVLLINNRGIVKRPRESFEKHFPEFTSEVTLTVPEGVTAEEIRRNAVPQAAKDQGKTVYKFRVAPAEILVVDLKGIRLPAGRKKTAFRIQPVKEGQFKPYRPRIPDDGYRFASSKNTGETVSVAAPEVIGCWKASDQLKDSSGNCPEFKLNEVKCRDGSALFDTRRSFCTAKFTLKYPVPELTYEVIVKPFPAEKWPRYSGKQIRGGIIYRKPLMLEYLNGSWVLLLYDRPPQYIRMIGPKAKPEWTHLAITRRNSVYRFFVNGREVKSPDGPLKEMRNAPRDGRTAFFSLCLGSLDYTWPRPYSFQGEIREFTLFGRALSADEIAARAEAAAGRNVKVSK